MNFTAIYYSNVYGTFVFTGRTEIYFHHNKESVMDACLYTHKLHNDDCFVEDNIVSLSQMRKDSSKFW